MRIIRFALILALVALQLSAMTAFTAPHTRVRKICFHDGQYDGSINKARTSLSAIPKSNPLPIVKKSSNVAVAGRLLPILRKFFIGPAKWKEITAGVGSAVDAGDLFLIAVFGWVLLPVSRLIYNRKHKAEDPVPDFKTSRLFKISSLISQVAKIAGIVYVIDVLAITLNVIGIKFPYTHKLNMKCAEVLYTIWAAWRLVPYKKYLIDKRVRARSPDDASTKIKIYDTLSNIIITLVTAFIVLDELMIPIGRALQSVFALGGVGTLVFSLASKDVASQIVNGIALASSNKYDEGDYILLGDGTTGTVCDMGWISTDLRGTSCCYVTNTNQQYVVSLFKLAVAATATNQVVMKLS